MKLSKEVISVLDAGMCEGNHLYLAGSPNHDPNTPRLEWKLYDAVNKAIVALGGKWKGGKTQAHVFEESPADAISDAIVTGDVENRKQARGFFETPAVLAMRLVDMADIQNGHRVLEPSAGRGRIVSAIHEGDGDAEVDALEIDPTHHESLVNLSPNRIIVADFMQFTRTDDCCYDRIIANPPFSKQQDISHVSHMHKLLKSYGVLVSVMSAGVTFRTDRRSVEFRKLVADNGGEIEMLPEGSFKESGTMVSACVVTIPKTI